MAKVSRTAPILTVSVAAELAGMHAQTVRQYDRLGLVVAHRTRGGGRRYSLRDVDRLIEIQRMSQEDGVNLAGISAILKLQDQVDSLSSKNARLEKQLQQLQALAEYMRGELERVSRREARVFAANSSGDVTMADRLDLLRGVLRQGAAQGDGDDSSGELVLWNPRNVSVWRALWSHSQ
ncbi:MAG: MerR family transcriptional regulator [Actinomycetaceae bacterium]|nr:MerR family transcriptional regulator [Arcanobacterium sp.]MDD7505521.1 MerR family transcriptional regulator [Actinomycetaceae bacterium]MDY6143502.1 MerR family transcriptional regulator [Arcanobacterium sp.]